MTNNEEELPLCVCGCGLRVTKPGNRFILGHNRRGVKHSPEHNAVISAGYRNSEAAKAYHDSQKGVPKSPEHIAAALKGQEEAGVFDAMRGGNDIVNHHYIYDHANPEKYTMKVTRSKHTYIHNLMRKADIKVLHINVTKENKDIFNIANYE